MTPRRRYPPNPATQAFADTLRAARLARGLSTIEVADQLNAITGGVTSRVRISSWETNCDPLPPARCIVALAEILGADPVAWCALVGERYPKCDE